MPFAFAVVCEAAADFRTATSLAERVIREHADWVDDHVLSGCPLWCGADGASTFLLWRDVRDLAKEAGIRSHGHFGARPAEPDAHAAQRALRLLRLKNAGRPLDGVLLIRDDDRDPRRRIGLEQARKAEHDLQDRIVIGLAHCKRECWVLAGYDPVDSGEEERLAKTRAGLGFDPRTGAHRLTATGKAEPRSAKRVLGILTQDDPVRESACWQEASLTTLRERGRENGLSEFLDQVASRLVPLFSRQGPT